jgi:hypothetical protein
LDIGENGTVDWALKNEYGPLGFQNLFNNGDSQLELEFLPGNFNTSGGIYLPASAEVNHASLELEFFKSDLISSDITELNRPEGHVEAPFDYDPEPCIFQERLYVAYRSYSWNDANQSDADIVINSTADGIQWQTMTIELTKAPDTAVPYQGGRRSGDFNPSLAVFKNHLYCAWESDSPKPLGSTTDTDRDILWTRFDGTAWEPPHELTAPNEDAAEDMYSKNPGVKHDYRVQLCTFDNGTGEQLFAIWSANNTGDENFPGDRIGDIVVSRTTDGVHWTTGLDLTDGDKRYHADYLPQLVEFEIPAGNALFAFWVTNNEALNNGTDWDIVYRYTLDGINWSDYINLLDAAGVTESGNDDTAIDEDPFPIVYNGRLYILWRSSNPTISAGNDLDIVLSSTVDGLDWSTPQEITGGIDDNFNNHPRATVFQDDLVCTWRTESVQDQGSIVLRTYVNQTKTWLEPITISPVGMGGNDYSAEPITFNNRILIAWVTEDNITTLGSDSDVIVTWLVPRTVAPEIGLDIGTVGPYKDDWVMPKVRLETSQIYKIDFTTRLSELTQDSAWASLNSFTDEFGNEFYVIPINSYFSNPGRIVLKSLQIQYNYSISVTDLSLELSSYLRERRKDDESKTISVRLRFDSNTKGKLELQNLVIVYTAPETSEDQPEILCIGGIIIALIILVLLIKFVRFRPKSSNDPKINIKSKKPASEPVLEDTNGAKDKQRKKR